MQKSVIGRFLKHFMYLLYFTSRVFGIRLGTCLFALLVVVGVLIVALGALLNKFWLMVAGRFIFGYVLDELFA